MKRRFIRLGAVVATATVAAAMTIAPAGAGGDRGNVDGTLVIGSLAPETATSPRSSSRCAFRSTSPSTRSTLPAV
jgi:hypothetical protein